MGFFFRYGLCTAFLFRVSVALGLTGGVLSFFFRYGLCTALLSKVAVELTRLVKFPASDVFMLFVEFIVKKWDAAKVEISNADCKNCVCIQNLKRQVW